MAETQPLLQPHNAPNRHPWYRLRISQSPAKAYYVIPLCCALGMLVGMVQAPLVQFVVSLVCSREAKTLQDTFHKPNTAVASHIFAIGRPREECESDATVQALSSRVLLVIQFCSALLCKYRWSCAFVLFGCMPLIYVAPVTQHYAQQGSTRHWQTREDEDSFLSSMPRLASYQICLYVTGTFNSYISCSFSCSKLL